MMRGRGRGRRRILTQEYTPGLKEKREFHENWILCSVWNPCVLQKIFDSVYHPRVHMTMQDFLDILQKCLSFYIIDEDLIFDNLNLKVFRVTDFNMAVGITFSDKPLKFKAREVKFQKILGREKTVTDDVTVECGGKLAEMLNGIVSKFDILIISGCDYFSNEEIHPDQKIVRLNDKDNCERLRLVRIPYIEEEFQYSFQLVEKVKPYVLDVFVFKYFALDPETNFKIERTRRRFFSAEQQQYDMNNPSGNVCYIRNPEFFSMPIHRYMSPTVVFDYLIHEPYHFKLVPISEDDKHKDEEEEQDIKMDTKLFTVGSAIRTGDSFEKSHQTISRIIPMILLTAILFASVYLLFLIHSCVSADDKKEINSESTHFPSCTAVMDCLNSLPGFPFCNYENSEDDLKENSELAVHYDWNNYIIIDIIRGWKDWLLNCFISGFCILSSSIQNLYPFSHKDINHTENDDGNVFTISDILEWIQIQLQDLSGLEIVFNPGEIIGNVLENMYGYLEGTISIIDGELE